MKKDYTHIAVVLDRSGSMGAIREETIDGFNEFLNDQKGAESIATLTLTQFDTEFQLVHSFKHINQVPVLNHKTYIPRGCTALYDAIGLTINSCGEQLAEMVEDERPEKVIFVILTDGEENSSCKFSYEEIQQMIEHQTTVYSWNFVFLGANINAVEIAKDLGIRPGNALKFAANSKGVNVLFKSLSEKMLHIRAIDHSIRKEESFFTETDRKKQKDAGLDNSDEIPPVNKGRRKKT